MVESAQGAPLSFEKKAALVNTLENTHQRLKAMTEATNPSSIGQYKRYALDIVTSVVPNLIAFDCYAVQALDNRVGMLNYIDYSYSKDKGATKKGTTFASSINMGKSDPWYTSEYVKGEQGGVEAEADQQDEYTFNIAWTPVILGSFQLTIDGHLFTADTDGNLVTAETPAYATGKIESTSGLVHFTLADKSGIHEGDVIPFSADYRFNNEDVRSDGFDWDGTETTQQAGFTNVPEIQLDIKSIPITAKARTLRSFWSFDAAYELQKELTMVV